MKPKSGSWALIALLLIACSKDTRQKHPVTSTHENTEEALNVESFGELILTLSSETTGQSVDAFLLAMGNIIVTLKHHSGLTIDLPLFQTNDTLDDPIYPTPIYLAGNSSERIFLGRYPLPSGDIMAIRLMISPAHSLAVFDGKAIPMTDSLGEDLESAYLNPAETVPDRVRTEWIQSEAELSPAVTLSENAWVALHIDFDTSLTLAPDVSLELSEKAVLTFTPAFNVIPVSTEQAEAMPVSLQAKGFFQATEDAIHLGYVDTQTFGYSLDENVNIKFNGENRDSLNGVNGQYFHDLKGIYRASGHHLVISELSLFSLMQDSLKTVQLGKAYTEDDASRFSGIRIPLTFTPEVFSTLNTLDKPLQEETLWLVSDKEEFRPLRALPTRHPSHLRLLVTQVKALAHPKLLTFPTTHFSDGPFSMTMVNGIACRDVIFAESESLSTCEGFIRGIVIPSEGQHKLTMIHTRRTSNPDTEDRVSAEKDIIRTFDNARSFYQTLRQLVTDKNYTPVNLSASGTLTDGLFTITDHLSITLYHPLKQQDRQRKPLRREKSPEDVIYLTPFHGLIAGATAGSLALGVLIVYKLKNRPAYRLQPSPDNFIPFYRWQQAPLPPSYSGKDESLVFQSPDFRRNPAIDWRPPSIPKAGESEPDRVYEANDPSKKAGGVTVWDQRQPRQGQLKRVRHLFTTPAGKQDNSGGTRSDGITFHHNGQSVILRYVTLKDPEKGERVLDLSQKSNHPIFEPGTGTYYFPKTPYQVQHELPADTLIFPDYRTPPGGSYNDRKPHILLGENVKTLLGPANQPVTRELTDLITAYELDFKKQQAILQEKIKKASPGLDATVVDPQKIRDLKRLQNLQGRQNAIDKRYFRWK